MKIILIVLGFFMASVSSAAEPIDTENIDVVEVNKRRVEEITMEQAVLKRLREKALEPIAQSQPTPTEIEEENQKKDPNEAVDRIFESLY